MATPPDPRRSVRFQPALAAWLTENLDRGAAPGALARAMVEQQMAPDAALAIVGAFVAARAAGRAMPAEGVDWDEREPPAYLDDAPRLPAGHRLAAADREIVVHARASRPALAVLGNVLDADECAQLIALARGRLAPSTLVDVASGADVVSERRQSFGMFFRPGENALVARLDRRFAALFNLPVENAEGLQVLHYPRGGGSAPHFDFLLPAHPANQASLARSGQRVATLVAYLNDVEGGGETMFPRLGWAVMPRRGQAVAFESCNRLGQPDAESLHASATVTAGEKWVVTCWMRERRFVPAGAAAQAHREAAALPG